MLEAFEVPPKDWDDTKKYFAQSDTLVKFPRKDSNKNILRKFSFIRVNKEIYAVGNKQYIIGEGNFGVVRLGQTEDKHPYAINVEGLATLFSNHIPDYHNLISSHNALTKK